MMIIEGTFDPITQEELQYLNSFKKQYRKVYIRVKEEGILPKEYREQLVERAIAPYRHLFLYQGKKEVEQVPENYQLAEKCVQEGNFMYCAKGTLTLIHQNGWYYEQVAKNLCNAHRYQHSIGVANTARQLAHIHHLDENLSYRMGLLHDITKRWDAISGEKCLSTWYPEGLQFDEKVWHSFTAIFFIKQNLCLHDTKILNAIWHHTLGDGASLYDHILYIADKIEPGRGYDASKEWELSRQSLIVGANYVREKAKKYILEKEGKHV